MKTLLWRFKILALILLISPSAKAEFVSDISLGSGYQANLFNDSSATGDTYAAAGLLMKYYPSGSTQLSGGVSYNAFATYSDLSNLSSEIAATVIPTSESSRITIALSGGLAARTFGAIYESYNRTTANAGLSAGIRLSDWMRWQSSFYVLDETYSNAEYGSNSGLDVTSGINFSIPGSNALSVRFDYSRRNYDQPAIESQGSGNARFGEVTTSQPFDFTGIMLRYSRPLGKRTGMNLSAGHRRIHLNSEYAVPGYTIDYLSPWSDLWEGSSFSAGLKRYFPKQFIAEVSYAFFDKNYVDVVEYAESNDELYFRDRRDDRLNMISLSLSRPVSWRTGKSIIPSLYLGYRSNVSTLGFYDYEDIVVTISIKATM